MSSVTVYLSIFPSSELKCKKFIYELYNLHVSPKDIQIIWNMMVVFTTYLDRDDVSNLVYKAAKTAGILQCTIVVIDSTTVVYHVCPKLTQPELNFKSTEQEEGKKKKKHNLRLLKGGKKD